MISDQSRAELREVLQETRESDDIAASHHNHAVDLVTGPELRNNLMMIKHLLFVTLLVQPHILQQSRSSPTREMQLLTIYISTYLHLRLGKLC